MLIKFILILLSGIIYGQDKKVNNPLLKEIYSHADTLSLEIPLGSSVYIADHTDFGGLESHLGGYVADQLFNHLSVSQDFAVLDRNPIQIILDQKNLERLDVTDENVVNMFGDIIGADIIVFGTITEFANKININSKVLSTNDMEIISNAGSSIKKSKEITSLISAVYLKNKENAEKLQKDKQFIYEDIKKQNKKFKEDLEKYKKEKLSIIKREYDLRIKNLKLEEETLIKSFPLEYKDVVTELAKLKGIDSELYSSELTSELFRLEKEFKEKRAELLSLKTKKEKISTLDSDIKELHQEIDKLSSKLSILKMGMTVADVRKIMGDRFSYDGRCGNFGKYVLVFTNNTLIKACKVGEIYTQFGDYAIVNDCEDCDDIEVKNLLKY